LFAPADDGATAVGIVLEGSFTELVECVFVVFDDDFDVDVGLTSESGSTVDD
jgi:hypothetical protein